MSTSPSQGHDGSEDPVRVTLSGHLLELVLNRPQTLNAMTPQMVGQIIDAVRRADEQDARVLLVRAEGRGFCSGRDLAGSRPGEEDGGQVLSEVFNPMVSAVADLTVPSVAAVQGACLGTGLGLALACDVVIVADTAKIGSPFGNIGAVLDSGGHKAFVDRLGPAVAFDLVYSGRFLSGQEAADRGLVSRCVPADELESTARELAEKLARGPVLAFRESKQIIRRLSDDGASLAQSLELEAGAQSRSSRTRDYVEGFTAFLERRTPTFRGE